jgi:hypothetical protein
MTIRTIQVFGQAYGPGQAEITVTANGNTVFSGTVPTLNQPVPELPNLALTDSMAVLFTIETDTNFTGQIPMTHEVLSDTVIFAQILANYVSIPNPVYTPQQLEILYNPDTTLSSRVAIYTQVANPPFSQQDIDTLLDPAVPPEEKTVIITTHNCTTSVSSGPDGYRSIDTTDARSNVTINGVAQSPNHGDLSGTWWWVIPTGSVLAYDLTVDPATV